MEGPNEPALNMRNIGTGRGKGASRRSRAPLQPANTVVTQGRSDGGKGEIRRQLREQIRHGLRDRVVTLRRVMRFVQGGIRGVKVTDRHDAPLGVTFAEDPLEVGLHDHFGVHWSLPLADLEKETGDGRA
jgi:hypothetical protein